MSAPTATIVLLGPRRAAVSGVSTHLNQLLDSQLARAFRLLHFEVGSEGRREGRARRLARLVAGPFCLAAYLVRQRAAVVHVNTSLEPRSYWRDLAFVAVAKLLRRKVVYQVHGGALPQDFFAGSGLLTAALRRVLRWPDVLVLLARVEMEAYARFVPGQRRELIANAIDAQPYLAEREPDAGEGRALRLAYVGRLVESKGVFEAVGAVVLLASRGLACELAIAGSGPDEPGLRRHVENLGVGGRVRFVGPLFDDAKVALWLASDLFVFPTAHREGLPYALLEGMAAGVPAVTTRVGAIPDVVRDGVDGVLLDERSPAAIADAIEKLAADRGRLRRLSAAARSRVVQAYGVERLAAEFERLYASVLDTPLAGRERLAGPSRAR